MFKTNKFDLLVSLYIACVVISELMGAKTFPLLQIGALKLNASVAILSLPLIFTINDVITEVYGKERARGVVRSSLVVILLLIGFAFLATSLPPSARFAASEPAYDRIFSQSIRISIASLIAFTVADFLDIYVFTWVREKLGKNKLWLRTNISNFAAQFMDTSIFMLLAFYGLNVSFRDNLAFLFGLILPYWLLKCLMSVIETPFAYLGIKWLKKGD